MPKRRCPFDATFSPQLKVHLSDKEVYFNKNGTSVTENIHGALKSTQHKVVPTCEHDQQNLAADNAHRYRQLRLGNQGQLVNTTDFGTKVKLACKVPFRWRAGLTDSGGCWFLDADRTENISERYKGLAKCQAESFRSRDQWELWQWHVGSTGYN
ncbi:UNVERIFIED_CONTAM: hypothetical protein B566_EDAN019174 [Ephemera danica]|nr:hypothetical protein B566_EDAN019174 [Ephemera danica]